MGGCTCMVAAVGLGIGIIRFQAVQLRLGPAWAWAQYQYADHGKLPGTRLCHSTCCVNAERTRGPLQGSTLQCISLLRSRTDECHRDNHMVGFGPCDPAQLKHVHMHGGHTGRRPLTLRLCSGGGWGRHGLCGDSFQSNNRPFHCRDIIRE